MNDHEPNLGPDFAQTALVIFLVLAATLIASGILKAVL